MSKDVCKIVQIQRVTWIGLFVNLFLSVIKFIFGILGGSHALIADAVHSVSDLSTDFAVIFGVKFWTKPPDEDHPYGHGRIETFITAFIGLFLFIVAIGIAYKSVGIIRNEHLQSIQSPQWIAFWGALISIVCKELLYHYTVRIGRGVKSNAVIANAWHHRTDSLSSIPVAIAVAAAAINDKLSYLDQIAAFVVALFIFYAGWKIIKPVILEILETSASQISRKNMHDIVLDTQGVRSLHELRTRRMNSGWYVDLHVQVDPEISVRLGHDISERVKRNLIESGADILDVIVHLEPFIEN